MEEDYKTGWLPHLKYSIPGEASITGVSLYTIALEAWRRNLKVKFYSSIEDKLRLKYTISNGEKIYFFKDSSGNLNTRQAIDICGDKGKTAEHLTKANIRIPRGKAFDSDTPLLEKVEWVEKHIKFPLVVKPVDGLGGKGVIVGIHNTKDLKKAIIHVHEELSYNQILIQEHIQGDELRVYVLENEVIAAAKRIPANIVGDGKKTIRTLINEKNRLRKNTPNLQHRPIKIDDGLKKLINSSGYSLDSVLKNGKRLFLRSVSNVSLGGEPVDYTDQLTEEQREVAIRATQSVPGLKQCGVDMFINKEDNSGIVIELNASPGIGTHLFPLEGQARDVPAAIIDYYFPETKNIDSKSSMLYYNLGKIGETLMYGTVSELELPLHKVSYFTAKKILLHPKQPRSINNLYMKLKGPIHLNNIHGFMKNTEDKNLEIVVGHNDKNILNEFVERLILLQDKYDFEVLSTSEWKRPIKLGFEYINGFNSKSTYELEKLYKQVDKEVRTSEKEIKRLKKRIRLMLSSKTWKVTKPLRVFEKKKTNV